MDDPPKPKRLLILGAAGRDYHLFNTVYRPTNNSGADRVVCFSHAQIPVIASSSYPASLATSGGGTGVENGNANKKEKGGIPIVLEKDLERAILDHQVDACLFAYSDVSFEQLGALAARVRRAGCDFVLPSAGAGAPNDPSTLRSTKPVVAVTAVRTGCGKSQVCACVCAAASKYKVKVALCRHPMPYGDLEKMRVQRFETLADLDAQEATVEEREEYEQHLAKGVIVFAGVDYEQILRAAEKEADVVIFDGGNNDTPFFAPDLDICVCDPFRPRAHETHYPGGINFARARHLVVNKANTAPKKGVEAVVAAARALNPTAKVYVTDSRVTLVAERGGDAESVADLVRGKRALCVDDGPTTTHGGVSTGAAVVAAREAGCAEVVDPRPFFVGALADALRSYPHIGATVPALGYGPGQIADLRETIRAAVEGTKAEVVVVGTPTDLSRVLGSPASASSWSAGAPVVRAAYAVEDRGRREEEGDGGQQEGGLGAMLDAWFAERRRELDAAAAGAAA